MDSHSTLKKDVVIPAADLIKKQQETARSTEFMNYLAQRYELFVIRHPNKNECWGWSGYINKKTMIEKHGKKIIDGIPAFRYRFAQEGKSGIMRAARLSWELHKGPIYDKELSVAHRCDNKLCTNPEHLSLCSHAYNMFDKSLRNRHGKKTTLQEKLEITRAYRQDGIGLRTLAKKYKVKVPSIQNVVRGNLAKAMFCPITPDIIARNMKNRNWRAKRKQLENPE